MGNTDLLMMMIFLLLLQYFPASTNSLELLPPVTFSSFNKSNTDNTFFLSEDSSTSKGALQVTPDSINNPSYLVNNSGRVLYNRPFTLWKAAAGGGGGGGGGGDNSSKHYTASFNTSFSINIYRVPNTTAPGEGFAFLIAPEVAEPPTNSYGGYLGLTNQTLDKNPSNHLVAVEFDTVKQPYDPDDNHVGLDINSVVSNVTAPLAPFGIDIAPLNPPANYTVWIDYDGQGKRISVRMARRYSPKPAKPVLDAPLDISDHVREKSYFGFAASTGITYQLNCVLAWNLTVERIVDDDDDEPGKGKGKGKGILVVAIGLPLALVVVAASVVLLWRYIVVIKKRRRRRLRKVGGAGDELTSALAGTLKSLPGTPREFEFKVLRKATHEFDEKMKLGQGGFGVVYKGVIPGEDTVVAVKKFSRDDIKGQDDFLAELSIINRLRHKHLVRLLGWCHQNGMLLLVYEFMPNGSLDQHLYGGGPNLLRWDHRYNILAGVASALHYLHNEYNQMVVHRDIKASNVLLDSNFNARLGDFGLARASDATDKTSSYVDVVELGGVAGTMGYIAPECFHTGRATRQSDVFAFGALVLEVVCSRRPRCDVGGFQFLVDWVWMLHREGRILEAVDPRLRLDDEGSDFPEEDAVRLLLLGLACSHPSPTERPKTAAIVHNITANHSSSSPSPPLYVPPFKPSFVWPSVQIILYDDKDDEPLTLSTEDFSPYYASTSGEAPTPSGPLNQCSR